MPGIEHIALQGFAADSHRVVAIANEPGKQAREFLFDPGTGKLQPLTPEGVRAIDMPGGKFLIARGDKNIPEILPLETGAPARVIRGWQEKDIPIQVTADGNAVLVAAYNGMSAAIYRVGVDNANRQPVKTLQMNDPPAGSVSPAS
jgi:hypothetical protein